MPEITEEQKAQEAIQPKPAHTPSLTEIQGAEPKIRQLRYVCDNPANPAEQWEFFLRERPDARAFYEITAHAEVYEKFDISAEFARSIANLEIHLVNPATGNPLYDGIQLIEISKTQGSLIRDLCNYAWSLNSVKSGRIEELKNA